jgi:hypothetical protein
MQYCVSFLGAGVFLATLYEIDDGNKAAQSSSSRSHLRPSRVVRVTPSELRRLSLAVRSRRPYRIRAAVAVAPSSRAVAPS